MIKVLNGHAGLGGNRKYWTGCKIVAVENNQEIASLYKKRFPQDEVIVADVKRYLLDCYAYFDFIWLSPPCQSHSDIRRAGTHRGQQPPIYPDMSLYQFIIFLDNYAKIGTKWVVENVKPYYPPLINPSFEIDRHLFWSNFKVSGHYYTTSKTDHAHITGKSSVYGFDISKERLTHRKDQLLRNLVDPALGLHIFNAALERIDKTKITQQELFT